MKTTTWIIVAFILTIPLGAFPIMLLSRFFGFLSWLLRWIGRGIDWFGWGGMLTFGDVGFDVMAITNQCIGGYL